jgi:hypothetical protein
VNEVLSAFPAMPLIIAVACAALFLRVVRSLILGAVLLVLALVAGAVVAGLLGFSLAALLM